MLKILDLVKWFGVYLIFEREKMKEEFTLDLDPDPSKHSALYHAENTALGGSTA